MGMRVDFALHYLARRQSVVADQNRRQPPPLDLDQRNGRSEGLHEPEQVQADLMAQPHVGVHHNGAPAFTPGREAPMRKTPDVLRAKFPRSTLHALFPQEHVR